MQGVVQHARRTLVLVLQIAHPIRSVRPLFLMMWSLHDVVVVRWSLYEVVLHDVVVVRCGRCTMWSLYLGPKTVSSPLVLAAVFDEPSSRDFFLRMLVDTALAAAAAAREIY